MPSSECIGRRSGIQWLRIDVATLEPGFMKFLTPNHTRFFAAINDKKMVVVRFYSEADHGVLDRICAPMGYGQGSESHDELNRYWLWDYAGTSGSHTLGLLPQEIMDLQVLGDVFDPMQFIIAPVPVFVPQTGRLSPPTGVSSGGATIPKI
jgi:hypothetical protein